jgi:ATP-binding cassette subfamily F protein uup
LFTRSFNLLVLDEPTNDLDIETLDLLEELLLDFSGTLLLVSHDRAFLDNVVTSTLVLEGDGHVGEYVGGYSDWLRQRPAAPAARAIPPAAPSTRGRGHGTAARTEKKRRLTFGEEKELAALPERIDALEHDRERLYALLMDPAVLRDGAAVADAKTRLATLEAELARMMERWESLETSAAGE